MPSGISVQLSRVYGFSGSHMRNNVRLDVQGRLLYPAASTVVQHDIGTDTQAHVCHHTDVITAMAVSPSGATVATGQRGRAAASANVGQIRRACIVVWDAATSRTLARFDTHWVGVALLAFSHDADNRYLVSVGADLRHHFTIYDLQSGAQWSLPLGERPVLGLAIAPPPQPRQPVNDESTRFDTPPPADALDQSHEAAVATRNRSTNMTHAAAPVVLVAGSRFAAVLMPNSTADGHWLSYTRVDCHLTRGVIPVRVRGNRELFTDCCFILRKLSSKVHKRWHRANTPGVSVAPGVSWGGGMDRQGLFSIVPIVVSGTPYQSGKIYEFEGVEAARAVQRVVAKIHTGMATAPILCCHSDLQRSLLVFGCADGAVNVMSTQNMKVTGPCFRIRMLTLIPVRKLITIPSP